MQIIKYSKATLPWKWPLWKGTLSNASFGAARSAQTEAVAGVPSSWERLCSRCACSLQHLLLIVAESWTQPHQLLGASPGQRDAKIDTVLHPCHSQEIIHLRCHKATEFWPGACPNVWTLHLVETHPCHTAFIVIKNLNQIILISPASPKGMV